jgi:SAM-dependent methyltransferase
MKPASSSPPAPAPLADPRPWNLVAPIYGAELQEMPNRFANHALELALPVRAPDAPPLRILDVAAGPGGLALPAAARGVHVTALDFSPVMIAQLRKRAVARGLGDRIETFVGDGQALPFERDSFDAAFSLFGLMFFPDRHAGLRELHRTLRPGARAVVTGWAPFDGPFALVMQALQELLPGMPFPDGRGPFCDPVAFADELRAAGFRDPAVHVVTEVAPAPSLVAFWTGFQRTNAAVHLLQDQLGAQRWAELSAGILQRLRAELGDGPVRDIARAHLGVGTK